jgi:hypothetical protein
MTPLRERVRKYGSHSGLKLSMKLSNGIAVANVATKNEVGSQFLPRFLGGDGGELNSVRYLF